MPPYPAARTRGLVLEGGLVGLVSLVATRWYLSAIAQSGHTFYDDVLIGWFGPEKLGAKSWVRSGFLPTWARDSWSGEPVLANIQHAILYPGNLPFWFLKTSSALDVVIVTHIALATVAMWAYCRFALRTGTAGSVLGGVCFGFGGVMLQHVILMNQLQVIAWMPLVLLGGHLTLERQRLRYLVGTSVAIGLQMLAGHPEEWVYTLIALALYGVAWACASGEAREWRARLRRAVRGAWWLVGSLVVFVLLFGWQLFPTLLLQSQSYRADAAFTEQHPLPIAFGVNALLPDFGAILYGENVGFVGALALGLAGLGFAARRTGMRWLQVYLLALGLFGFLMALGNEGSGLYRFLYHHVSLVAQFRVPARWLVLTSFAFAALAALGTEALLHDEVGRLRQRVTRGLLGLATVVGILGFALLLADLKRPTGSLRWFLAAAVVGVLVWAVAFVPRVPRALPALVLIAFTALELHAARPHAEYHQAVPAVLYDDPGPVAREVKALGGRYLSVANPQSPGLRAAIPLPAGLKDGDARTFYSGWPRRLVVRPGWNYAVHAPTVVGRDGGLMPTKLYREFFLSSLVDRTGCPAPGAPVTSPLPGQCLLDGPTLNAGAPNVRPSAWRWPELDALAIRTFLTPPLEQADTAVLRAHGFTLNNQYGDVLVWVRPAPPTARMIYTVDDGSHDTAEQRTARLAAGLPMTTRALVDQPVGPFTAPSRPAEVSETHRDDTSSTYQVRTDTAGLLVAGDPWYPQWTVRVDGKKAKLRVVDHAFQGVVVPAGSHEVEFRYVDTRMRVGFGLAGLTVLALAGTTVWTRRRRGRSDRLATTLAT